MWRLEHSKGDRSTPESLSAIPSTVTTSLLNADLRHGQAVLPEWECKDASCSLVQDEDDILARCEQHAASNASFWVAQDEHPCWVVPMGRDPQVMPWLASRESGMGEAMARARAKLRTVLLVDDSADQVVDTFFRYRHAQVIDVKRMVVEVHTRATTVPAMREEARRRLVNAMRYGHVLYIRLANCVPPFRTSFTSDEQFPLALFDHEQIHALNHYHPPLGENLYRSEHPLAKVQIQEQPCRMRWLLQNAVLVAEYNGYGGMQCLLHNAMAMAECGDCYIMKWLLQNAMAMA